MTKAILLSHHELLNDLYSFNLKAFCDVDIITCHKIDDLPQVLADNPEVSLLISLGQLDEQDAPVMALKLAKEAGLALPMIIIGDMSKLSHTKKVYTLPANLNIPLFIKTCAKILGITAKDMAAKEVPEFYPIPLSMLRNFTKAPCDVYIKVGNEGPHEFSQALQASEELKPNVKLDSYAADGVLNLFIPSSMRLKIVNQASEIVLDKLEDTTLTDQDRVAVVEQGYEVIGGMLGENPKVTPEIVDLSKKCMESVTEVLNSVPKLKHLLGMMLQNKTGHLYFHSVVGTYISRHIIKEISWGSEEHAEKLSFVFYFHDIFLAPIFAKYPHLHSEENLVFQEGISEKEKEIIINHARLASEMVKNFPRCPMGADAIISQHHGTSNGMGFALEYKDDISPLAKVLIVSEAFTDELIQFKNAGRKPDLEEIMGRLREKFPKHTYKKIINCLETIRI